MDNKIYNEYFISIKDECDVSIKDSKWNSIFQILCSENENVYFTGSRLQVSWNDETKLFKNSFIDKNAFLTKNGQCLFTRINKANLLINRNALGSLWGQYEFSSIDFLKNQVFENKLKELFVGRTYTEDVIAQIPGYTCLSIGVEPEVLWIKSNMNLKEILNNILKK